MKKGILYGIGAYVLWGLLPVYWKWLHQVPALQLVSYRIVWSFISLIILLFIIRRWEIFYSAVKQKKVILIYLASAFLLNINWLTYVWAVNAGFIVESSLGYFINPLISILLGVIFLRERLRVGQWIPVGLVTIGVIYITIINHAPPWIALTLAISFGAYGLVKKIAPLEAFEGLTLETAILFLPALFYILFSQSQGNGALLKNGSMVDFLLIGSGVVTVIPLLLFASAARRIPLSLVGILQYIAPTLQFLIGVFIYHEPFTPPHLLGFGIIWLALLLFWGESYFANRKLNIQVINS